MTSDEARALAARRKTHRGGKPPKLRPCPYCQKEYGGRAWRVHVRAAHNISWHVAKLDMPEAGDKARQSEN